MFTKFNPRDLVIGLMCAANICSVQAGSSTPLFIWDNQEGVKGASSSCEIKATDTIPFRVSQYTGNDKGNGTENLRNFNGVRQSHLIDYSVVKQRIAPSKRDYMAVEVVGINKRTNVAPNRWFSERGDQGYLYEHSIRPMEDFVFEVPLNNHNYQEYVKNYLENLSEDESIFLRVASGRSYYKLECANQPDRDYILFRAYQKNHNEAPLFYLAVSEQETGVFNGIKTYGKVESMKFLAEVGNEAPILVDQASLKDAIEVDPRVEEEQDALEKAVADAEALAKQVEEENEEADETEEMVEVEDAPSDTPENREFISTEQVVCIGSTTLNVRDADLNKVLFKANLGEKVKVFQTWTGDDTREEVINGVTYTFKRVEFPEREATDEKVGFVAAPFIKKLSDCAYLNDGKSLRAEPVDKISGLDDPRCCDFPTVSEPTHSYTSGMRRFGAGRSKGKRKHAACDLYRYLNEPIRSVAPGKVIRNLYAFYQGTYALEVRHDGGFVVRYGELTSKTYVRGGNTIKMGQRIGNIGVVNSGCCRPMLHFELYKGTARGALSTGSGSYRRRSDLMDPTPYLLKWQDRIF